MKRLIPFLLFTLVIIGINKSQDFRKFKVGMHAGYVAPEGGGGGIGFALEPGYRITDKFAVNLRAEATVFTRDLGSDQDAANLDVGIGGIGSYTANVQYYFLNGPFRPYIAFGLGYYVPADVKVTTSASIAGGAATENTQTIAPDAAFGFYPRIGFDLGHFNMMIDYNIVGDSESNISTVKTETKDINGTQTTTTQKVEQKTTFKNSYLSVKLGFTIGGGKK